MSKLNFNNDDNSIDYDFFDTDLNRVKTLDAKNRYSSKIITKAVIETKPEGMSKIPILNPFKLDRSVNKNKLTQSKIKDCISSPTSSEERRLIDNETEDMTLFNCLAFGDYVDNKNNFTTDEKYYSDNSLSDSTITTVTSDFTTVSCLSSMSDSSCGSDLSSDSSPQAHELGTNGVEKVVQGMSNGEELESDESERLTQQADASDNYETVIGENDNFIKSRNYNSDHERSDQTESPRPNSTADSNIENTSNYSECEELNIDGYRENIYEQEASKENLGTGIDCDNKYEKKSSKEYQENKQHYITSRRESTSTIDLEDKLGDISLASQASSDSSMAKAQNCRMQNRFRSRRKDLNLTFSREELIRIERDNTILLKKIMAYSKPRSVLLNHTFSHKKTSAAINRARQQKKIEQDNYILYSKINAMNRMKKVF